MRSDGGCRESDGDKLKRKCVEVCELQIPNLISLFHASLQGGVQSRTFRQAVECARWNDKRWETDGCALTFSLRMQRAVTSRLVIFTAMGMESARHVAVAGLPVPFATIQDMLDAAGGLRH
eukprot:379273-Rhodomonas_salina.1